jgi:hypothetical protein
VRKWNRNGKREQERRRGDPLSDLLHVPQKLKQEIGRGVGKSKMSSKEEGQLLELICCT